MFACLRVKESFSEMIHIAVRSLISSEIHLSWPLGLPINFFLKQSRIRIFLVLADTIFRRIKRASSRGKFSKLEFERRKKETGMIILHFAKYKFYMATNLRKSLPNSWADYVTHDRGRPTRRMGMGRAHQCFTFGDSFSVFSVKWVNEFCLPNHFGSKT